VVLSEDQKAIRYPNRWKKGQSGNPAGRPPNAETLSSAVRDALAKKTPGSRKTHLQLIIAKAIEQAVDGDDRARSWLSDRGYGKAVQPIAGDGDGGPIRFSETLQDSIRERLGISAAIAAGQIAGEDGDGNGNGDR
jgi:stage V sporulation protein SpoVS